MKTDFHTHTTIVDGKDTPEAMVRTAAEKGLSCYGISDHGYVPFDPDYCMSRESIPQYRAHIARLKEQYEGEIELLCGLEMDYYTEDDPEAYDYVIGSVHYMKLGGEIYSVDQSQDETRRCVREACGGDWDSYAEAYFEHIAALPERTHANIIGHCDLITIFKKSGVCPDEHSTRYRAAWQGALRAIYGKAALEVNTGAMSRGYRDDPYPGTEILRYWRSLGGKVILSSDAHKSENIIFGFDAMREMLKNCGYTKDDILERPYR